MSQDDRPRIDLEHEASAARDGAERFACGAKHDAEAALGDLRNFLRRQWTDRPLAVTAAAIGLGALIGLAASKRR